MKKILLLTALSILFTGPQCLAQAGAGVKRVRNSQLDSAKLPAYPYHLPLLGHKMAARGFDVTYPIGIMLNGMVASQLVNITNLQVGFNDGPMQPFDFIKFGQVKANIQTINTRIDCWILPFMDVYGILGGIKTSTTVDVVEPVQFSTKNNFNGKSYGVGTTLAGGFMGLFMTLDMNVIWTDVPQFTKPINSTMITPRIGKVFYFKKNSQSNIAFWAGPSYLHLSTLTEGTIKISDLTTDASKDKLENIINGASDWYNNLPPVKQAIVKPIVQALIDKLDGLDIKDASVHYSLSKSPTANWSMVLGGQYQLNKRWQFRAEGGFLGGRSSFLLSTNFRFPI